MEDMGMIKLDSTFWRNKNVLVTGHTGFKGSWLTLLLSKLQTNVFGIALPPYENSLYKSLNNPIEKSNFSYIDISEYSAVSKAIVNYQPNVIFHLAAQAIVSESYIDPISTYKTNVLGSLNLLESTKLINHPCVVILVTTDKVYKNNNWSYAYRENDPLGAKDPYSSSKVCMEILSSSWRESYIGFSSHQKSNLSIATVRAGNVIGGGDWSINRLVPDIMRSLYNNNKVNIRNPYSTRPWQHVLDPISGYVKLAHHMYDNLINPTKSNFSGELAINFGPDITSNKNVLSLVNEINNIWPFEFEITNTLDSPHEEKSLNINSDLAYKILDWQPKYKFNKSIEKTVTWYKNVFTGMHPLEACESDIEDFLND